MLFKLPSDAKVTSSVARDIMPSNYRTDWKHARMSAIKKDFLLVIAI